VPEFFIRFFFLSLFPPTDTMARSTLIFVALALFISFVAAQTCTQSNFEGKWKESYSYTALNTTYEISGTVDLNSDNSFTASGTLSVTLGNGTTLSCPESSSGSWSYVNSTNPPILQLNTTSCSPTNATNTFCSACATGVGGFLVQTSNCTMYFTVDKQNVYLAKSGIATWVIAVIIVGVVLVVGVVVGLVVYRRYKHHQRHIYETA